MLYRTLFITFIIVHSFTYLAYSQTDEKTNVHPWKIDVFTFANLPNKMQVLMFDGQENKNYAEVEEKYINLPGIGVRYAVNTILFDLEIGTKLYLYDNDLTMPIGNHDFLLEGKNNTLVWLAEIDWLLTQSIDPVIPYLTLAFGVARVHTKTELASQLSSPIIRNNITHDGSSFAASTQLGFGLDYYPLKDLIDLSLSYNYIQLDYYTLETHLPEQIILTNLPLKDETTFGPTNSHQIRLTLSYQLK